MSGAPAAPRQGARLWLAWTEDPEVRRRSKAYRELLSPEERRRLDRFRVARGRDEYLLGRALARTALSSRGGPAPAAWRLVPDERGRPQVAGPPGAPRHHFNLAHSHGLVACLVTGELPGGVDVESTNRRAKIDLLAERYLAPDERAALRALPAERRPDAFFCHWTLKEAYLKARGLGIALPLRALSFRLDGGRIEARFDPAIGDEAAAWRFDLFRAASGHLVATALPRGASDATPRVSASVPLGATRDAALELVASTAGGS